MANCAAGCIADFLCDGTPSLPVDGTNLAPYVRLGIEGAVNLTVGNDSSPFSNNTAVIKSFQFGSSNGSGTSIEILDEQGGDFEKCMDKINKCITKSSDDYRMWVEFGWIDSNCNGGGGIIKKTKDKFYFIPLMIEATYTEGKIRFNITGSNLLELVFEARQSKTYPKQSLKSAIRQMMADCEPKIKSVKFLRRVGKGTEEWNFKGQGFGPDGPETEWQSDMQNKLAVAMDWIKPYRTEKDRGVKPTWNERSPVPEVIFWEDPDDNACNTNIGNYIVNGGNCSPVISFTPSAKWVYGALHANSGGTGGAFSSKTIQNQPLPDLKPATDDCSGLMVTNPIDARGRDTIGPSEFHQYAQDSYAAHDKANRKVYSMEAELRIQGDPDLAGIEKTFGTTVSIVVINPFHISGGGNGRCGDWLASPGCNPVYSNKSWFIRGIDHSIKEGSYVTTLKVVLVAPGSDIGPDEVFGGPGSGGWSPPTKCST